MPMPTSTQVDNTNGTALLLWESAPPPGCTALASTDLPLTYNNKDTYLPDILICRPELADDMLEAAAGFLEENGSY